VYWLVVDVQDEETTQKKVKTFHLINDFSIFSLSLSYSFLSFPSFIFYEKNSNSSSSTAVTLQ
jgi:hypothetical protein